MVKKPAITDKSLMKKLWPTTRKSQAITIISLLVVVAATVLLIIFWQPLIDLFSSQERVKEAIDKAGFWGPFLFMALQFLQVVFAPIPGQVVGFAGGYAFGGLLGGLYSMIGTALGFTLVFLLARKLGRPFVQRFVSKKLLDRFDYLTEDRGVFIFFLIFLLPAFPDDIICYLAGLSKIPLKTLVIISLIGRAPSVFLVTYSGAGAANNNIRFTIISMAIAVACFLIAVWKRRQLESFVERFASKTNK